MLELQPSLHFTDSLHEASSRVNYSPPWQSCFVLQGTRQVQEANISIAKAWNYSHIFFENINISRLINDRRFKILYIAVRAYRIRTHNCTILGGGKICSGEVGLSFKSDMVDEILCHS